MSALLLALVLSQNYQAYPVAPRASGMGGAATALGEGAANTFYNPAALAFGHSVRAEVSGNIFGLDGTTITGEIGDASSHTRVGLAVIPSNMSLETHGLDIGPIHLSDRWGLGLSILAPLNFSLSALINSVDSKTLVFRDTAETVYTIYNDIAYRVTDTLGLGVSIVAMYRTYKTTALTDHDNATSFESLSYVRNEQTLGHTIAFGAQWKPENGVRVGLSMRLPLQSVFGFGDEHSRTTQADKSTGQFSRVVIDRLLDVKFEMPWRFNLGLAWERVGVFAIAGEMILFTPYQYLALREANTGETLSTRTLKPVMNFAVGAELYVAEHPIRLGFFTDRSPLQDPLAGETATERVDRYGATLSTAFHRAVFDTEVGLLFAAGSVRTLGYDNSAGHFTPIVASGFQWRLMVTYSSVLRY